MIDICIGGNIIGWEEFFFCAEEWVPVIFITAQLVLRCVIVPPTEAAY